MLEAASQQRLTTDHDSFDDEGAGGIGGPDEFGGLGIPLGLGAGPLSAVCFCDNILFTKI